MKITIITRDVNITQNEGMPNNISFKDNDHVIDTMEEGIEVLKKLDNAGYFKKSYDVKTPVSRSGDILFNEGKSVLTVDIVGMQVDTDIGFSQDYRKHFKWVQCNREELREGDTGYRTNFKDSDLLKEEQVCKIVDLETYYFTLNGSITRAITKKQSNDGSCWYKLTKR